MKKKHICILIFTNIVTYIIGMKFPIKNILPILEENRTPITVFEFHSLIVNWVLAIFTFTTIIVALLKEDIIRFLKHPKIYICKNQTNILCESLADVEQNRKIAKEYYSSINIENNGNFEARNIDIVITKIMFLNTVANTEFEIPIENKHIKLKNSDSLLLFPSMTCSGILFSLSRELNSQTNSSSSNSESSYILKIGENIIDKEYQKGEIKLLIQAYCDGGYKDSKILKIKWDGKWKDRLSDISPKHLCIEEVNENEF